MNNIYALSCRVGLSALLFLFSSVFLASAQSDDYITLSLPESKITTPDSPEASVGGDIEIIALIAPDSWNTSNLQIIVGKTNFGTDRGYYFGMQNGDLIFRWSVNGPDSIGVFSSEAVAFGSGIKKWVRVTRETDNGAGSYETTYYTSDDGVSWTQLGNVVGQPYPYGGHDSTAPVVIGNQGNAASSPFYGKVYYVEIRDGIGGTVVSRFDASDGVDPNYNNVAGQAGWTNSGGTPSNGGNAPPDVSDYIETPSLDEDQSGLLSGTLVVPGDDPDGDDIVLVSVTSDSIPGNTGSLDDIILGQYGTFKVSSSAPNTFVYDYDLSEGTAALDALRGTETGLKDRFNVVVEDSNGADDAFYYEVTIDGVNDLPELVNPIASIPSAMEGDASYSYSFPTGQFSDAEDDQSSLTWILSPAPDAIPGWLSFDSNTAVLTAPGGIPSSGAAGTYNFSIKAVDADSAEAPVADEFSFVVTAANGDAEFTGNVHIIGNLGIGPGAINAPETLAVDGTVLAKKVVVDADWADFVFEDGYDLLGLEEVEGYISENGRLPGVPSAEEVQREGVSIGESQTLLLQKIEELTLYLIDQRKEIVRLKEMNEKQNSLIEKLLGEEGREHESLNADG